MAATISCAVCGGLDFALEDGGKICLECGGYQLNYQQLIEDESVCNTNLLSSSIQIQQMPIDNGEQIYDDDWCTFEAYNIILKKWVDSLVQHGASEKFKDAVFKVWMLYIQKRKVAFVGKPPTSDAKITENDKEAVNGEKLGLIGKADGCEVLTQRDARVLRGIKLPKWKRKRDRADESGLELLKDQIEKDKLNKRNRVGKNQAEKQHTRFIAKKLSETLNASGIVENHSEENAEVDADQPNSESECKVTSDEEVEEEKKSEEKESKDKNGNLCILARRHNYQRWKFISPLCINLPKVLAILYLGVLISDEDILLLDVLRLCREEKLPYLSSGYLVPEDKRFEKTDIQLFNRNIPPACEIRNYAATIAMCLSIQALPLPSFKAVTKRIVDELHMPDEILSLADRVIKAFRQTSHSSNYLPPFETAAAASVLLAFKIVFGMNDVHEELLSNFAEKMNKTCKEKKIALRLFSWREWHSYINRVKWWKAQLCPGLEKKYDNPGTVDSKRFSHYFWSKGIWKTPMTFQKENEDCEKSWSSKLIQHSFGDNLTTIRNSLEKKQLFSNFSNPAKMLQKYISEEHLHDPSENKHESLRIAKELVTKSFTNHRFNWLESWREISHQFGKFGRPFTLVKIPLPTSNESVSEFLKKQNSLHNKDNAGLGNEPVRFVIPDPLSSYWVPDNMAKTQDYYMDVESLPQSFRWLLKTLSDFCETYEVDVYSQFGMFERKYIKLCEKSKMAELNLKSKSRKQVGTSKCEKQSKSSKGEKQTKTSKGDKQSGRSKCKEQTEKSKGGKQGQKPKGAKKNVILG